MVEFRSEGGNLHGTVNPGPNAIEFSKTSFDSSSGEIKMELNGPNSRGEVVHYAIEGKLSGATMSGTFDRAGETGTFRLEKQ